MSIKIRAALPEGLIYLRPTDEDLSVGAPVLDESGVSTQMTRLDARRAGGRRIREAAPGGRGKILTILGAIGARGTIAAMAVEAATDREMLLTYLDEALCPQLRPGEVVAMDKLGSHKAAGVGERIEAAGAEALCLAPYSPDPNPTEKAWSKLEPLLRAVKARSKEALDKAISELEPQISPQNAQAWFRLRFATPQ